MDTNCAGVLLSTTSQIDNRPILEYLGIVNGEAVMRTSLAPGRSPTAKGRARSGSIAETLEQRIGKTRCAAIAQMAQRAAALGGTAVIAVSVTYTTVDRPGEDETLIITASGTVVIL